MTETKPAAPGTAGAAPSAASLRAVAAGVEGVTAETLDVLRKQTKKAGEDWNASTTLEEIGVDSFDLVEMIFEVEEKYGVSINFNANTTTADLQTVGDVAKLIFEAIRKEAQQA